LSGVREQDLAETEIALDRRDLEEEGFLNYIKE